MPDHLMSLLQGFARNEAGATSIEYALIAVGIALAIVTTVPQVGSKLAPIFSELAAGV